MEASFWTTMETHPQQAPLGIINMLISRRALVDSISRSLEVLYEMPYTTDFPPGLPTDLEQLLRDLRASTERLMDEVTQTNRLLHRLALFPPQALQTQLWIPNDAVLPPLPQPYGPAAPTSRTSSTSYITLTRAISCPLPWPRIVSKSAFALMILMLILIPSKSLPTSVW